MCGSPSVDNSAAKAQQKAADLARFEEDSRLQRLDFGQAQIDAIFGGGTSFDNVSSFLQNQGIDPRGAPLSDKDRAKELGFKPKARIAPTRGGGEEGRESIPFAPGKSVADQRAAFLEGRADPRGELGPITSTNFAGFEGLIDRRRQAGLDVALPQLDRRFGDAKTNLAFNLSRAGLSNSSQAAGRQAELGEAFQLEEGNIRAGVEGDVTNLRSRIASAKADAELQLRATSNPSAAASTALASRTRFSQEQPSGFTIGDIFANALSGIGTGVNAFRSNQQAQQLQDILASSTTTGSGRVVA